MANELERIWKEIAVAYFKVEILFQNLPDETDEMLFYEIIDVYIANHTNPTYTKRSVTGC
jgi:hypothetical protein